MNKADSKIVKKIHKGRWNSEMELTMAAANMNRQARYDLADMLCDRVYRLSACLAGKSWEPEDLAQTSLIEIVQSAGNYRGESSLHRWADRITVLTALKKVRKLKRRALLWEKRPEYAPPSVSPHGEITTKLFWDRMHLVLSTLSPDRRTAIVLHHIQEYTIGEISVMTNTLPNTVRDRLRIARKQLRTKLEKDPILKDWVCGRFQ